MTLHPIVQRFIQGSLPEPMVMALVGGGLPLPTRDLLHALAHAGLRDTPYRQRALAFFETMPESLLAGALAEAIDPPAPLDLVLRHRKEPALLETVLLNPSITPAIVEGAIPSLPGAVLEIVLNNQVLWLQRPRILDLLEEHPEGEYVIKRRINEFRFEVLGLIPEEVKQDRLAIIDAVEAGHLDRAWSELPLPKALSPEEAEAEVETEEMAAERRLLASRPLVDHEGMEINLTVTQRVAKLSTNQKIMLAIKGGKEERNLLIREANRLIQVNVLRNGRITEGGGRSHRPDAHHQRGSAPDHLQQPRVDEEIPYHQGTGHESPHAAARGHDPLQAALRERPEAAHEGPQCSRAAAP